jgi:hypothetical protein
MAAPAMSSAHLLNLLICSICSSAHLLICSSAQRIGFLALVGEPSGKSATSCAAQLGRIGAFPLREGALVSAGSHKQGRHTVVPLVAPWLLVDPIRLAVLSAEFRLDGPRFRPRRGILERHGILERVRVEACPPFDEVQVFAGSLEVGLGGEIGDVDDQRIAFPATP